MSSVEDRLDIIEVCTRMAWHADQREWERLREIFTESVALDYTSLNGGEPITIGAEQIGGAWKAGLGGYDATQHILGNHLVTLDGDTAVCTAVFQATHRLANPFGSPLWTLGGTYRFDLVRDGGWRIRGLVMTVTWADGNQNLATLASERS
ncbi:nuclear transport factor 2 family protein [Actinomadura roseirufa]|uniref:nuclear transport factor 2 family protein n=1 Tax=Actinomadura roseirufa TaxID=2094049 RepID=UPI0010414E42|nr:nuclear transport factor 2 family protein [Actinomadura roseirufa]